LTGNPTGNLDALAHLNAEVGQMARRAKGEGAVYRLGDGRWEAKPRSGVGRRKSVYGRTRREVLGKLREVRLTLKRGLPVSSRILTLAAFLERWLEVVRGRVRANTYESYELNARRASAELGEVPLQSLSPALIEATKVVQQLLGYKTVATTLDNYSHVRPVLHGDAIRALDGWLGEAPTL
jgi:hypothetical protein